MRSNMSRSIQVRLLPILLISHGYNKDISDVCIVKGTSSLKPHYHFTIIIFVSFFGLVSNIFCSNMT